MTRQECILITFIFLLCFFVIDCVEFTAFESRLVKEQLQRSSYHINTNTSDHFETHPYGTSTRETYSTRRMYQSKPSSTLLAIIHSSEVAWPARVEVLANVFVTLEGSYSIHGKTDGFEVLAVLDSEGEVVRRHQCRDNHMTMMRTTILPNNHELCDSKQLMESSGIPHVVAGVSNHRQNRRRGSHVHPASAQKQYVTDKQRDKWPFHKYRPLWHAAVQHCRNTNCEVLVTCMSSSFIPRGTITLLAAAAQKHKAAVVPTFDDGILDDHLHHKGAHITIGSHPLETATHISPELKKQLDVFLNHPLNYERVSRAIHAQHVPGVYGLARPVPLSDINICEYVQVMTAAVAMPLKLWEQLEAASSHSIALDECQIVIQALHNSGGTLAVHYGAYLVSRLAYRAMSLLSNVLAPSSNHPTSGHKHLHEGVIPSAQPHHARTLFTVTCAGIWHRTLSMMLSLEVGEALGKHGSKFDFMLAVTPRDDDTSSEFMSAAGVKTLVQPRPIGLTNLWNLVLQYCVDNKYEYCFISNNDVLIGAGSIGAMVNALSKADLVIPFTKRGAGTLDLDNYSKQYKADQFLKPDTILEPVDAFLESPLSFQRIQNSLNPTSLVKIKSWMAFCFGLRADWVSQHYLEDGSHRLWNDTRWKNYAQEKHLPEGAKMIAAKGAYVHHFRGGTLDSASCKNGWLDCATWQDNHRPDMESEWFTPE